MSSVDSIIESWKTKLIDLTRRNRLIYFKPGKMSALRVLEPSPFEIFKRLVLDEKDWQFLVPEPDEIVDDGEQPRLLSRGPGSQTHRRRANELLCGLRDVPEATDAADSQKATSVQSVLRNLYRRSRTEAEERGITTLHLAFGLLEWQEQDQSATVRSPLVLVPVELGRVQGIAPFKLSMADDEITLNPALEVKLQNDFSASLPAIPDEWADNSLEGYLDTLKNSLARRRWKIIPECWLCTLSYHKLVMYQDLKKNAGQIRKHFLPRNLAGEVEEHASDVPSLPVPEELDTILHPKDSYLILDADSSQLACIEAVKRGLNVVVQGPPGTGKSQTISNIIAESIAAGKKVLFVSEKMAALEVVYKRLKDASLDHYCLVLHSHKANKRDVVQELAKCFNESQKPNGRLTASDLDKLAQTRQILNGYVSALNRPREEMGRSAFRLMGEYARLDGVPEIRLHSICPGDFTYASIERAVNMAEQLAQLWHIAMGLGTFPWRGYMLPQYGPQTKLIVEETMHRCCAAVTRLFGEANSVAEALGFPRVSCLKELPRLERVAKILQEGPGVPASWITSTNLAALLNGVCALARLAHTYEHQRGVLLQRYTEPFLELAREQDDQLKRVANELELTLGSEAAQNVVLIAKRVVIRDISNDLKRRIAEWSHEGGKLAEALGQPIPKSIRGLKTLLGLVPYCCTENKPLRSWFADGMIAKVRSAVGELKLQSARRDELRSALFQHYHESVLELDVEVLLRTYNEHYVSLLRFLKPGYYRLRKSISDQRKAPGSKPGLPHDLSIAVEFRLVEAKVEAGRAERDSLLGSWYRGCETDFASVESALVNAEEILTLSPDKRTAAFLAACCVGFDATTVEAIAQRVRRLVEVWEPYAQPFERILEMRWVPGTSATLMDCDLDTLYAWNESLRKAIVGLCEVVDKIDSCRRDAGSYSVSLITQDIAASVEVRDSLAAFDQESLLWRDSMGSRWTGLQTDWQGIKAAIEWTERIRAVLEDLPASDSLVALAAGGGSQAPSIDALERARTEFVESLNDLSRWFDLNSHDSYIRSNSVPNNSNPMMDMEIDGTRVESMSENSFTDVLNMLKRRVEEIRDWISFRLVRSEFETQGLTELYCGLLDSAAIDPSVVPRIAKRTLLGAWLQWLYTSDPMMASFRGGSHQNVVAEFRELDRKHRSLGYTRVIAEAERRKPSMTYGPAGEPAILMKEAAKKSRHWPLRRLFATIPNLLFRIKPCLLMSPLSVSQYLDPESIHFDVVIFDEASQVRPQDGIAAVYRGDQLVVCGDSKQLPPTTFFDYDLADEYYDEEQEDEVPDEFENLLDQCSTIGLRQMYLKWHYRSRHENLIAFSNNQFYGNKLVTFPSPWQKGQGLGVELIVVEDGIYRRGKERDNPREADRIVQIVGELLRDDPESSVGVVAFSISQADAIENRFEIFMKERPELAGILERDVLERFFVKNLENVQGDERDIIILSVGYGKDSTGRLSMNFGPLNKKGGEKRLNVAVTRARKRLILVSSLVSGDLDITATNSEGVRQLYHYLAYAERGPEALEIRYDGAFGEFESPLEEDVASVIRSMGYVAVPQVGCSDYRIDLGVALPDQPGTFVLGVECDGAMYHSGRTARDRDRLRQEVLENLGWRIHRIWSPDWTASRKREIDRLKNALDEAKSNRRSGTRGRTSGTDTVGATRSAGATVQVYTRLGPGPDLPKWVQSYELSSPRPPRGTRPDFHDPMSETHLKEMLLQVLEIEAPIHVELVTRRLIKAWGIRRAGSRVASAITKLVSRLQTEGRIRKQSGFLWLSHQWTMTRVRRPDPLDIETQRRIDLIAPEEIELALEELSKEALSLTAEELVIQSARILGFERTGDDVRNSIEKALKRMVKAGRLEENGGRLSVPNVEKPK